LRQKYVFTLSSSEPVGPTRFGLDDLIHSAVHIQLTSILSLTSSKQTRVKYNERAMGNKVRVQVKMSDRKTLTKARCSKANGNRQHAVDVTVTA
jgi:hypothetical protein